MAHISGGMMVVYINYGADPVAVLTTLADNAIPNNSQAAGGLIATASGGACLIEDVVFQKDGTALTGPTNVELSTDNAGGPTGTGSPIVLEPITSLGGNGHFVATQDATTYHLPYVLESGKKLYIHGDDAAGTSAGNTSVAVYGRALANGAKLV